MSQSSNFSVIKDALDVFNECIKNGNDINNLCEKCTNATVKSHPIFKKLVDKIQEDTKVIEKLKSKVDILKSSIDENNYQKWKTDLGDVISSLESASFETISKISYAMASSGTKRIKQKFEENEKILSEIDLTTINDDSMKNFFDILTERNRKIVDCLKYAHSLMPKFFKLPESALKKLKTKRKLFIIGEDLSKSLPVGRQYGHLGEVIITSKTPVNASIPKLQVTEFRQNLNGYLIDDSDKIEVLLKLKEPIHESMNLMEFSQNLDTTNLSATIEINGQVDDDVEVVEITVNEVFVQLNGASMVAVVENSITGDLDKVPVQLVPITPEKSVHGKIIEIQSADEPKEIHHKDKFPDSIFNSTFKFDSSIKLPHFATPSRKMRQQQKSVKSHYYTPVRKREDRLARMNLIDKLNESLRKNPVDKEKSLNIVDQIVENTADKVFDAIMNKSSILEEESELEYANMSSIHSPNLTKHHPERTYKSPGRKNKSVNLDDISEIQYADFSSIHSPNLTRQSTGRSFRSPGQKNKPRNLDEISEIQYADMSSVHTPNLTRQSTGRSFRSSHRVDNLEDISQIEFANISQDPNASIRNLENTVHTIQSPNKRYDTSIKTTPIRKVRPQPAEGILIDIGQSPQAQYANVSGIRSPNLTRQSPGRSFRSPGRRDRFVNLDEESEIQYVDMSSILTPSLTRQSPGRYFRSPGRKDRSVNLDEESEIQYADMSSIHTPNLTRQSPGRSFRSPGRKDRSVNLDEESEIQYADMSSIHTPNLTRPSPGRSFRSSRRIDNLEDISQIEFANLSGMPQGPNTSVKNLENTINAIQSPKKRHDIFIKSTPVRQIVPQPAEGILVDIGQSPHRDKQNKNAQSYGDNLIQLQSPNYNQDQKINELMQTLTDVLQDDASSRLNRRQKVHDRSFQSNRKEKSTNKILNRSLPVEMPMTSGKIEFKRPVQVIPSRIPEDVSIANISQPSIQVVPSRIAEDAPIVLANVVAGRPLSELSPLRPLESQRINQALDQIVNPFASPLLQIPPTAASQSFYENQPSTSGYNNDKNLSLPLHLTPKRDFIPMSFERSLMSAYNENQQQDIDNIEDEEDLENISAPPFADENDSSEDLNEISNPFSNSFDDFANASYRQQLPVQPINQFMARFDNNLEDLDGVSFEFMDDEERGLMVNKN